MLRTVFLAALALSIGGVAAAQEPVPQLKAEVVVSGDVVRVGDLVANAGALTDIGVFRSPDPGHVGAVPVQRVLGELRRHGLTEVDAGSLSSVTVTRLSRRISVKEIEAQITEALAGHAGFGGAKTVAITFDRHIRPLDLDVNAGDLRIARASYSAATARFDVVFEQPSASGRAALLHYTGTMVDTVDVAVLTRPVPRGEVIRDSDVAIERRPKSTVAAGTLSRQTQLIGLAPRRDLQAAQPLRAADLMKPELVRQHDTILVTYQSPGITLTLRAQALNSGALGDTVNVLNIQSKRTMQGVVVGPSQVTIESLAPRIIANQAADAAPAASSPSRTE